MKGADLLCKSVSLHQLLASSFIFLIIWINIDLFFAVLPNGTEYSEAKWVVFILGLSNYFFDVLFNTSLATHPLLPSSLLIRVIFPLSASEAFLAKKRPNPTPL